LFSCASQLVEQRKHRRVGRLGASGDQIPQLVVRQGEQFVEHGDSFFIQRCAVGVKKSRQYQIVFEQSATAAPTDSRQSARLDRIRLDFWSMRRWSWIELHGRRKMEFDPYTARLTMMSLILPIAAVGFKPLGQTSTQFMIVWQRNNR
jgi:hypothetical protein